MSMYIICQVMDIVTRLELPVASGIYIIMLSKSFIQFHLVIFVYILNIIYNNIADSH